eukprot:scaffold117148_cov33-Phaeocystis_antarctica.AAC.1
MVGGVEEAENAAALAAAEAEAANPNPNPAEAAALFRHRKRSREQGAPGQRRKMTRQDSSGPEINLGLGPDPFDLGPDLLRSPQDAVKGAKVLLPSSRSYYCLTNLRTTSLTTTLLTTTLPSTRPLLRGGRGRRGRWMRSRRARWRRRRRARWRRR